MWPCRLHPPLTLPSCAVGERSGEGLGPAAGLRAARLAPAPSLTGALSPGGAPAGHAQTAWPAGAQPVCQHNGRQYRHASRFSRQLCPQQVLPLSAAILPKSDSAAAGLDQGSKEQCTALMGCTLASKVQGERSSTVCLDSMRMQARASWCLPGERGDCQQQRQQQPGLGVEAGSRGAEPARPPRHPSQATQSDRCAPVAALILCGTSYGAVDKQLLHLPCVGRSSASNHGPFTRSSLTG